MKKQMASMFVACGTALISAGYTSTASAGTYQTIDINGASTQFASVPDAATAPANATTGGALKPIELKIANDSTYLYLEVTYAEPVVVPQYLYLGIDSDNDPSTGYDDNAAGIGANLGFENDFPFTQGGAVGVGDDFNTGGTVTSATATATGNNILQQAIASDNPDIALISIPLDTTQVDPITSIGYTGPDFIGGDLTNTIGILAYTGSQFPDVNLGPATYTIALTPTLTPEPASLSLLALAAVPLMRRRRSQMA